MSLFSVFAALLSFRRRDPHALSDVALIRAALDGDARAGRALVDRAAPPIRARVLRHVGPRRVAGLDVDDLTHEVWCRLLDDDGRRLRAYDPARGKTLGGYLSMIAGQLVANVAEHGRAQRRSAPGGQVELNDETPAPAATPEARTARARSSRRWADSSPRAAAWSCSSSTWTGSTPARPPARWGSSARSSTTGSTRFADWLRTSRPPKRSHCRPR
jgi:DNA-directed RNA polymerase specialized sigma24 family protein